jgi:hypothetical protein
MPPVRPSPMIIWSLRSTLAFVLMLGCAGPGCLIVCYAHSAAMSGGDTGVTQFERGWGVVSASMGTHACCKARHRTLKRSAPPNRTYSHSRSSASIEQVALLESPPSGGMSCCPLANGSFVVASRSVSSDENVLALNQRNTPPVGLTNSGAKTAAIALRFPNQGQTYLTCCAFLI